MLFWLAACTGPDDKETGEVDAPTPLDGAGVTLRGDAGDLAGSALAAGDLDGDGAAELVVGALGGRVACVVTPPFADGLMRAGACLEQAADYDYLGQAVATGDLDGDGVAEVYAGGSGHDATAADAGAVWRVDGVLTGPIGAVATRSWLGEAAGDGAGSFVATGGDTDGDGLGEVLIGAPSSDRGGPSGGALYVAGASTLAEATVILGGVGPSPAKHASFTGDGVGVSACGADLDGDGISDVAAGAPGWDAGGVDAGAVGVYLGPFAGTLGLEDADQLLVATVAGGYAGGALACGGDTDGDGVGELLVGADAGDGRVYLWRGAALDDTVIEGESGSQAGYSVAFVEGGVVVGLASADTPETDAGGVAWFAAIGVGTYTSDEADARWAGVGAGDLAGAALAAMDDLVAVGAPYNRDEAPIGGAVYLVPTPR